MRFPAQVGLLHFKMRGDSDRQNGQNGGAKNVAIAPVMVDGGRHPAEKGSDSDEGCRHRQGETVVKDVDVEDDFPQKGEGVRKDGQAYDERDSYLRIVSFFDELNKGRNTNHN